MLDRVLVPMDDSVLAERALAYALENHPDASVTVLTVVDEPSMMMGDAVSLAFESDIDAAAAERAEPVFDRASEIAADHDAEIDTVVAVGRPARAIVTHATDYDAVVMGSHSSEMVDWLFVGNVTDTVFKRAPVPVTVVR
ncbi:UspA domain protein [Natrinema mahii]|nr:UspA domain protein [Natrinema mahii]